MTEIVRRDKYEVMRALLVACRGIARTSYYAGSRAHVHEAVAKHHLMIMNSIGLVDASKGKHGHQTTSQYLTTEKGEQFIACCEGLLEMLGMLGLPVFGV